MSSFSKFDPRNKLATVNDALSSLINNKFIPDLILKIALDEIDAFVHFFREIKEPSAQQLIELLMPGKKVIEVALKGESSIKEVVEVAYKDFNSAIEIIGELINNQRIDPN